MASSRSVGRSCWKRWLWKKWFWKTLFITAWWFLHLLPPLLPYMVATTREYPAFVCTQSSEAEDCPWSPDANSASQETSDSIWTPTTTYGTNLHFMVYRFRSILAIDLLSILRNVGFLEGVFQARARLDSFPVNVLLHISNLFM